MNNGVTSKYFSVGRGVRQRDPLSPYLFILALEVCSCKIRKDPSIKGISVNNVEIKIIQFADDTTSTLHMEKCGMLSRRRDCDQSTVANCVMSKTYLHIY